LQPVEQVTQKNRMRTLIPAILACLLVSAAALAAPSASEPTSVIATLAEKEHFTILKQFPTRQPGLTGYVVKTHDGRTRLLFGMGAYVFSGTLIDVDGNDATREFADAQLPKPDYATVAKQLAADPHLVSEGRKGAPEVFVFADPNCIFCHKFWQLTRNWVKDGKLRLHWVMVGFLKSSSPGRAAAIMAAKHGATALAEDETGFDENKEEGAIKPLNPVPDKFKQVLASHSHLMAELNFGGTPSLLFRDHKGNWQGIAGVPGKDYLPKALGFKP
jgi:thiol:disulfide interchange protein DsbG